MDTTDASAKRFDQHMFVLYCKAIRLKEQVDAELSALSFAAAIKIAKKLKLLVDQVSEMAGEEGVGLSQEGWGWWLLV